MDQADATTRFDHHFEGFSVWLELEDYPALANVMDSMRVQAFPQDSIDHTFPLHATVLYNFHLDDKHDAMKLLRKCRVCLRQDCKILGPIVMRPEKWFTFDYPKTADNGKGFGAAISLMLLQPSPELTSVHETVTRLFPDDERKAFTPHLSLVYAPQQSLQSLTATTDAFQDQRHLLDTSIRATSLSVWSTAGQTKDWYRIASIPLDDRNANEQSSA